jgi:HAMP domain-containing protein
MAGNLTNQVRNIAEVTTAVAKGDLSRKITVDVRGEILSCRPPSTRWWTSSARLHGSNTSREVGTEGNSAVRPKCEVSPEPERSDGQRELMAGNLTSQVRNIAQVTTAVRTATSQKITVDVQGEILELKNTINTMVDQLNSFA